MGLISFSYFLAVFLFVFAYYLDSRSDRSNATFTSIAMTSAFVALFAGLAASLIYTNVPTIANISIKIAMICMALVCLFLVRFSFVIPYYTKHVFLSILGWLLAFGSLYVVFVGIGNLSWSRETGFIIKSKTLFGMFDGLTLFAVVYLLGLPAVAIFTLIVRSVSLRSRIYRQRLQLIAMAVSVGMAVCIGMYFLSLYYFWALPLVPFGLALMLVLIHQSVSITTLFDRTMIISAFINFILLTVIFSSLAGFITALVMGTIEMRSLLNVALVLSALVLLVLRMLAARKLRRYVRVGTEYGPELEAGFEKIDYTAGGQEVIRAAVELLTQYVECASVDILVSDDKGKLATSYSTSGSKNEVLIEDKALDFMLNHNETIVLKTQAITSHVYAECKTELLKIFDIGHSDAMILIREGRRIVGLLLLGAKKRGSDYTDYDFGVLSKLYSNFFLVMYYLKNIANESVVLTVDRELEFSGQIISSIQDNIDRINNDKVDVDFITQSARKLGGDFIDFIRLSEQKYLYVMGDVSGKGLNASMSMVILKSVIRTFLNETGDFKQLVCKVNGFIKNNLPKGTFFAGVFALMDFSTNTMFYINCGVPIMLLYTAAYNNAIEIQGEGRVLGFVKNIDRFLKVKKIVLNPLDIILLTTDGLVDSTNLRGERFGKDRIQRMLMDNRTYPAGRIAKFLCDSLSDYVSRELEDDITVLVFKYLSK